MLTRENLTKLLQDRLPYLTAEFGVEQIGLFGSYAKDAPTEDSDVDIVAEFGRPIGFRFVEFTEYLERLLNKRVDVLTPAGITGIRLPHVAHDIREHIVYV